MKMTIVKLSDKMKKFSYILIFICSLFVFNFNVKAAGTELFCDNDTDILFDRFNLTCLNVKNIIENTKNNGIDFSNLTYFKIQPTKSVSYFGIGLSDNTSEWITAGFYYNKITDTSQNYLDSFGFTSENQVALNTNTGISWSGNWYYVNITSDYFTKPNLNPEITYEIDDATFEGKKLIFNFKDLDEVNKLVIKNATYGLTEEIEYKQDGNYIIDNIKENIIYLLTAYKDDELVATSGIVEINSLLGINSRYYIIMYNSSKTKIMFYLKNAQDNDKCYYELLENTYEFSCDKNTSKTIDMPDTNTILRLYTLNSNELVAERYLNIEVNKNLPYFTFNSKYNEATYMQDLEIVLNNYREGDIISISINNNDFYELPSKRVNILSFANDTTIDLKVTRDGNVTTMAHYLLKYNNKIIYGDEINDINNSGLMQTLKKLISNKNNGVFKYVNTIYEGLSNSKLGPYIFILSLGSIITLIILSLHKN